MFRRVAEYAFEYAKNNGRSKVIQFLSYLDSWLYLDISLTWNIDSGYFSCKIISTSIVHRIQILWIRKILASCIRMRKNMWISGSKAQNIYKKLQKKKIYSPTPNLNYWKREITNISWFLYGSLSFSIKKIGLNLKILRC